MLVSLKRGRYLFATAVSVTKDSDTARTTFFFKVNSFISSLVINVCSNYCRLTFLCIITSCYSHVIQRTFIVHHFIRYNAPPCSVSVERERERKCFMSLLVNDEHSINHAPERKRMRMKWIGVQTYKTCSEKISRGKMLMRDLWKAFTFIFLWWVDFDRSKSSKQPSYQAATKKSICKYVFHLINAKLKAMMILLKMKKKAFANAFSLDKCKV